MFIPGKGWIEKVGERSIKRVGSASALRLTLNTWKIKLMLRTDNQADERRKGKKKLDKKIYKKNPSNNSTVQFALLS